MKTINSLFKRSTTLALVLTMVGFGLFFSVGQANASLKHDCFPGQSFSSVDGTFCGLIPACQPGDIKNHRTGAYCPGVQAVNTPSTTTADDTSIFDSLGLLKKGTINKQVEELQKILNILFGSALVADGNFGSLTRTAVLNAQRSLGISIDGVVGKQTADALKRFVLLSKININRGDIAPTDFTAGIDLTYPSSWGTPTHFDDKGNATQYVRDFGPDPKNGKPNRVTTFVIPVPEVQ